MIFTVERTPPCSCGRSTDCSSVTPSVKIQIQFEHINYRLAEHAEQASFIMLCNQGTDAGFIESSGRSNAVELIPCRSKTDVGVEAAARGRDKIHGNLCGIVRFRFLQGFDASFDGSGEVRVVRPEVGA